MMKKHDLSVVGWRAWYTDGREFTSADTRWEDLPELGVLKIIVYNKTRPYSKTFQGSSLYWLEKTRKGDIYCCDNAADAIISKEAQDNNRVKRGKWVTDNEMQDVEIAAAGLTNVAPDESLRVDRE